MFCSRKWKRITITLSFLFLVYHYCTTTPPSTATPVKPSTIEFSNQSKTNLSQFIIDTPECKIPRTPIFPKYFTKRWRIHKIPDCSYEKELSVLDNGNQILDLLPEYANSSCCLYEIFGIAKNESSYSISGCLLFNHSLSVEGQELLLTKCGHNLNIEANILIKPQVQEKLTFWKGVASENIPISVLFLGLDTVSRSHAFRSLPKSMKLLKTMGFTDFPGYHSVEQSTLSNFMAFLMGLARGQVRKQCAPDWETPFDSCPLIWKEFGHRNYVTMYFEDGVQTFNWGGQSGFHASPTDYYIHPLMNAIADLRLKHSGIKNTKRNLDMYQPCASTETIPQFMLRYTKRFTEKFQQVPSFTLTWITDPFHEYMYSVANFDEDLWRFFQNLQTLESFLDRTLIIFASDHGDRLNFFESETIEAFAERGLPPLFIRFPKKLKEKFGSESDFEKVLKQNAKSLLSPFDLHHTFLHILELNSTTNFVPVLQDRQSLFLPIESLRNCEKLNITAGTCVCNTATEPTHIKNPFYLTRIIKFVAKELNKIVTSSKYASLCTTWTARVESILSGQVLQTAANFTDILLQFEAKPDYARFEVKVRIEHEKSKFDRCKLIGKLSRINSYGKQSSCLPSKTDADKEMKNFCLCKSRVIDKWV